MDLLRMFKINNIMIKSTTKIVAILIFLTIIGADGILSQVERDESMQRVNVPVFFNMEKARQGGHLDISVLSGLVKVQREGRTNATSRSMARTPMSVSVFGVPVYRRGNGNFDGDSNSAGTGSGGGLFGEGGLFGPNGIGGLFGVGGRGGNGGGGTTSGGGPVVDDDDLGLEP